MFSDMLAFYFAASILAGLWVCIENVLDYKVKAHSTLKSLLLRLKCMCAHTHAHTHILACLALVPTHSRFSAGLIHHMLVPSTGCRQAGSSCTRRTHTVQPISQGTCFVSDISIFNIDALVESINDKTGCNISFAPHVVTSVSTASIKCVHEYVIRCTCICLLLPQHSATCRHGRGVACRRGCARHRLIKFVNKV